ncbi:YgjP-like metallopeptidase domain-containing protein [Helicobacter mesocricetorum]|uniref:YgjP-like metallopeptidase domain-containing protein n=1 Tax=Helicobacter mesocricetorum TaxID=87012 RepID=UPI001F43558B|nr:YgjP-like metallopeptidase domain-containing protein [Helicobacter mesocricetorum]
MNIKNIIPPNIQLKIIKNRNYKYLRLQFKDFSTLLLTAPKHINEQECLNFLQSHKDWIITQVDSQNKITYNLLKEKIFLFGEWIDFRDTSIQNLWQDFITAKTPSLAIKTNLQTFYQKELHTYIQSSLSHWCSLMNLYPSEITYGKSIRQLGCCYSNSHKIRFSLKLSLIPKTLIDSVIIHELAHIKYPNHQKEFWNLVLTYDKNPKNIHLWLKENHGFNLYLYKRIFKN